MFDLYSPYIHIDCVLCKEPLLGYDATIKFIFYLDLDRSMRFEEVKGRYDSKDIETNIENFWGEINAYEKQKGKKSDEQFFFVDGPPYTTGNIHLGTAWNKIIKDAILRYKRMDGFSVTDRPGWDMHGLPIEVKVEEELKFKSKKDIERYGVAEFVEKCIKFALRQKENMTEQFKRLGVWMDWENPYVSIDPGYMESAWWTLKEAYKRDLLKEGFGVVNWCPRCETAIAESEVEYEDMKDPSIYVRFPLIKEKSSIFGEDENVSILIWTTTPWTIPANIAVAVNPDLKYLEISYSDDGVEKRLILAENCLPILKKGGYEDYKILKSFSGRELEGLKYVHPLKDLIPKQEEFEHRIFTADFVTDENTGSVHIAPGHGEEDFQVGKEHDLPIFCPVNGGGKYTEEAGKYRGTYVRRANIEIIKDLDERGFLFAEEEILHRYGRCWRCKTPIIYLSTRQWYIKVPSIREEMLKEISEVKWYPDWAGSERFYDWVSGARDWCISRQRYWGIPIPIWRCDCGNIEVIGSIKELMEKSSEKDEYMGNTPQKSEIFGIRKSKISDYLEYIRSLHRPEIDDVVIRCERCGGEMKRIKDVFDVWFDSAMASWATLGFPRDKKRFEELWPADFITEGHDQTRGWFYSQLAASTLAFGKAPYKSVLMHGFTLDSEGNKMSKSLGNVVSPLEVIGRYGADALRLYVLSNAPWEDLKFSWEGMKNTYRILNILWNVYRFPLPYMNLDDFDPSIEYEEIEDYLREEDRWIISRSHNLIKFVRECMERYELHGATRRIRDFVLEDLSRWYIQLVRPRTWVEKEDKDKLAAYYTIYTVLMDLTRLMAPFTPYLAEKIYQNLNFNGEESIHLSSYPRVRYEIIDDDLEKYMDHIRDIVESAANAREKAKRKLRWPIKRLIISPDEEEIVAAVKRLESILKVQTNTKAVESLSVGERLEESEDVVSSSFNGGIVYLDVELTEEIMAEGYAREIIRRIQQMRKDLDLNVEDFIEVSIELDGESLRYIKDKEELISTEVRASRITYGKAIGDLVKAWDIAEERVKIGIS